MSHDPSIPPLRDLPFGRLGERREHLLSELGSSGRRFRVPAPTPTPRRAIVVLAVTAALVAAFTLGLPALDRSPADTPAGVGPGRLMAVDCFSPLYYRGDAYEDNEVSVTPVRGRRLGAGTFAACGPERPRAVEVAAIKGVPPSVAIFDPRPGGRLFINVGADRAHLPPVLRRALVPVVCRPADNPIAVTGRYVGLYAVPGNDSDLLPPYDLVIDDAHGTPARYEHAVLTIRVPAGVGPRLDAPAMTAVAGGGTVSFRAVCRHGRLVATRMELRPAP